MTNIFDIYADCKADHAYALKVLRFIAGNHPAALESVAHIDEKHVTVIGKDWYIPNAIFEQVKGMPLIAGIKHLRTNMPGLTLKDGKDIYETINPPNVVNPDAPKGTDVSFLVDGTHYYLPITLVNEIKNATSTDTAMKLLHDYARSNQYDLFSSTSEMLSIVNNIRYGYPLM